MPFTFPMSSPTVVSRGMTVGQKTHAPQRPGARHTAHLMHELLREPGGNPRAEGELPGALHERASFARKLLAGL